MQVNYLLMLLAFVVVLANCGGGGGGGGASLQPPAANLTGSWLMTVTDTPGNNTCGQSVTTLADLTMTQSAGSNNFTVSAYVNGSHYSLSGTISGSSVSMSGSYQIGGGTENFNFSGTLNSSTMRITGTSSWNWNGTPACSGTSSVTVTCSNCSSGGGGGGGAGSTGTLTVINHSSYSVYYLYVWPYGTTNQYSNKLPSGQSLSPGFQFNLHSIPAGSYSVLAIGNGVQWDHGGNAITITSGQTFTWTLQ
jgi:hypothetical protein